jgi:acid phosphatase
MPKLIADSDMIYLRATPIPRALESVQQAFWGFYPPSARTADFPAPTIVTRTPADETLFPNDSNCRRFAHLSRAFAQRTAERWNDSEDMQYLSNLFSKWMPGKAPVKVDSHPRLSGIMDTINATDAHGSETRLPKEFYDPKARAIIDKIGVEEWYAGYAESAEYRMLGIGGLMGDITSRMTSNVERRGTYGVLEIGGNDGDLGRGRGGETNIKFAMSGCHDTTLAAVLTSLGAFEGEHWPRFSSHIAVELFRKKAVARPPPSEVPLRSRSTDEDAQKQGPPKVTGWWASLFGPRKEVENPAPLSDGIARKTIDELTEEQRRSLDGYFVRIRYNDKVMQVPGCKVDGKHLEGDTTFCTLVRYS